MATGLGDKRDLGHAGTPQVVLATGAGDGMREAGGGRV
jgi:hypothetical protein